MSEDEVTGGGVGGSGPGGPGSGGPGSGGPGSGGPGPGGEGRRRRRRPRRRPRGPRGPGGPSDGNGNANSNAPWNAQPAAAENPSREPAAEFRASAAPVDEAGAGAEFAAANGGDSPMQRPDLERRPDNWGGGGASFAQRGEPER